MGAFAGLANDDLDFLIECIEEAEETVGGKSLEFAAEQRGNPGLVGAEQVRCLLLGQLAFFQNAADAIGDLSLRVELLRVREF